MWHGKGSMSQRSMKVPDFFRSVKRYRFDTKGGDKKCNCAVGKEVVWVDDVPLDTTHLSFNAREILMARRSDGSSYVRIGPQNRSRGGYLTAKPMPDSASYVRVGETATKSEDWDMDDFVASTGYGDGRGNNDLLTHEEGVDTLNDFFSDQVKETLPASGVLGDGLPAFDENSFLLGALDEL